MITRSLRKALEQIEKYDIQCVSFVRKTHFIFDEVGTIISEFDKKPTIDDMYKIKDESSIKTLFGSLTTNNVSANRILGGVLYISSNGTSYFVPNNSGNIDVSFSPADDAYKVQPYIVDNLYTLDDLIIDHKLEHRDYVVFRVSDGNFWADPESDGLYHLRDDKSRRIELWYTGIKKQI